MLAGCAATGKVTGKGPATVAVWPFDDLSIGCCGRADPMLMQVLTDSALMALQESPGLEIVERTRLEAVLQEQNLGSSQLADEDTRLRLGRLLGARWMLFGSYQKVGPVARLDMRVVDVETSKVLAGDSRVVELPDEATLVQNARELAMEVMDKAAM